MTTIRIHFLGGTIGYVGVPGGEPVRMGADALLGAVPGLDRLPVTLDVHAAEPVPSASLTFAQLSDLAHETADACAAGTADAVVVVQGTDTLEESAYLLDLLWDRPEPVVLTGAMRNPTLAGADGPANLVAAVSVAADPRFRELGALVVLADEVHPARSVQKVHTTRPHAFASPDGGPMGVVVEGRPTLLQRPATDAGHSPTDRTPHRAGAGADRRTGRGPGRGRRARVVSPTVWWWPPWAVVTCPARLARAAGRAGRGDCPSCWPAGSARAGC